MGPGRREEEELVLGEEVVHAAIDLGPQARGAADIGPREGAPLLDVPDHRVFQLVAVIVEKVTVTQFEVPGAKDVEHLVGAAQVGFGLDEIDAEVGEDGALGLEHCRGARIDRETAQVAAPGNADSRKSRSSGRAKIAPGSSRVIGDRRSGPAMTLIIKATSPTVRANGPFTVISNQADFVLILGTRPGDGRNPTTLQ